MIVSVTVIVSMIPMRTMIMTMTTTELFIVSLVRLPSTPSLSTYEHFVVMVFAI